LELAGLRKVLESGVSKLGEEGGVVVRAAVVCRTGERSEGGRGRDGGVCGRVGKVDAKDVESYERCEWGTGRD